MRAPFRVPFFCLTAGIAAAVPTAVSAAIAADIAAAVAEQEQQDEKPAGISATVTIIIHRDTSRNLLRLSRSFQNIPQPSKGAEKPGRPICLPGFGIRTYFQSPSGYLPAAVISPMAFITMGLSAA